MGFEIQALRGILAGNGCLIVAGAVMENAVSMLLSIAVCLACASRIERNYQRGAYGIVEPELLD